MLGYAYELDDADGDLLIDGFEHLLGTDPLDADSDCDGVPDGVELPPAGLAASDPLDGVCGADLEAGLTTGIHLGGTYAVNAEVTNLGPETAVSVTLDVLFESADWDWGILEPAGCTFVEPPKGEVILGTKSRYLCTLASLADAATWTRGFTVTPSRTPSTLDVTLTVAAATPDRESANNGASVSLTGGLLQ